MHIDDGIFRSIVILNSLGFTTTGSCSGHLEREKTSPWIQFSFKDDSNSNDLKSGQEIFLNTLFHDLEDFYKERNTNHQNVLTFTEVKSNDYRINLYPHTNLTIFTDNRNQYLETYLKEINDFCEFLNIKYKLNF